MMKNLRSLWIFAVGLLLASCSSGDSWDAKVEYLPFKAEKGDKWGMISKKGEVLFEDEFERTPSMVLGGRFFVENAEGMYEMYAADEKPKQVGDVAWKGVCDFTESVTPAVEKGKPIALIDRDGKVVKEMNAVGGKTVLKMRRFEGGRSVFQTTEKYYGMVDTDGEVVVEAKYISLSNISDGKAIGVDKKYEKAYNAGEREKLKYTVLDRNGKELCQLNGTKIVETGYGYTDGLLVAGEKRDDKVCYGLLDDKGEWALKPSSKIEGILQVRGKQFVFSRDNKYGVMNLEGETLIRAKYDALYFVADGLLAAYDSDKSADERWRLIDMEGEQVGDDRFRSIVYNGLTMGDYLIGEVGEDDYGFIDKNGEIKKLDKGISVYDLSVNTAGYEVESDYVDYAALLAGLDIKADGMTGMTLGLSAPAAIKQATAVDADREYEPENYTWRSEISYDKELGQVSAGCRVAFDGYIGERLTRTVKENYYGYTFSREETTGYSFSDEAKVTTIAATFSTNGGKLDGKGHDLYLAAAKKLKTLGREVKSNANAIVIGTGEGRYAVAFYDGSQVMVAVVSGNPDDMSISQYDVAAPVSEPDEWAEDSAAVDSEVVESVEI